MNRIASLFFFIFLGLLLKGQSPSQTVKGILTDGETNYPLEGGRIVIQKDSVVIGGALTDSLGRFSIKNIPVGRVSVQASYIGYHELYRPDIQVISGKESFINLELEERIVSLNTVEITATEKGEVLNEMASVSARTFSIENTDRYAGSRGDPARMVSNFAGVNGADDSRNDIVVRGNSPLGVMYRLEGVDIPNPNHFAIFGTTGGPVGILSNKVLRNSDFFTGAFPAEYGNALAGVFDLKMRNGNNEKHEFMLQLGLMGLEAMAEGPISKKKRSSYMATYRYSTFTIFDMLNINLGVGAIPKFQDASFKLNFPMKKGGKVSLFGIGGTSQIDVWNCERNASDVYDNEYGKNTHFGSKMGTIGLNYTKALDETTSLKITLMGSGSQTYSNVDSLGVDTSDCTMGEAAPWMHMKYTNYKAGAHAVLNKKFNARHSIRAGVIFENYWIEGRDSTWERPLQAYKMRANFNESTFQIQAYTQWKYKITEALNLNVGLHVQDFGLNGSGNIEPRAGVKWTVSPAHKLSLGYGLHSQNQALHTYFQQVYLPDGSYSLPNRNIKNTNSHHIVMGWDWKVFKNLRTRFETYYQSLYNVPVHKNSETSYTILNQGADFDMLHADSVLSNKGTARNYGIELTIEKFFSKTYFFMVTGSLYDSKYRGSDGVLRNTNYNGNFALNVLGGKEFTFGKKKNWIFSPAPRMTWAGGKRYSPILVEESEVMGYAVYDESKLNSLQFEDYLRVDLRLAIKTSFEKWSQEFAIDLVNVFNIRNDLSLIYNTNTNENVVVPQLGFLPVFYYKVNF